MQGDLVVNLRHDLRGAGLAVRLGMLIAAALILTSCGRDDEPALAVVGDRAVTEQAFRQRYATLLRKTSMRDNLLARQRVLQELVDEELLLSGAREEGLQQQPSFREEAKAIEEQVLLDQYRKLEVFARVKVTEQEVRRAYVRLNTRVTARHLYARTKDEAQRLSELLKSGASFEDLAATTFHDSTLAANGGLVGTFTLGDMDPAFEDAAFTLPIGTISDPVKTQEGYSIIKVENRVRKPILSEWQFQRRKKKIAAYVRWQKEIKEAKRFTQEIADRLDIRFNEPVLNTMADRIAAAADSLKTSVTSEIPSLDYAGILAAVLDKPLVLFQGGAWTVAEFLEQARWTSKRQQHRVRSREDLQKFIRGLVVRHYLLRDARRRGIQRRADTRDLIAREIRNLTLRRMKEVIAGRAFVPDSVLRADYEANPDRYVVPEEVNVREILVESKQKAQELLDRARAGEDFADLARRYSLRQWAAERGGELGFAPRGRYGMFAGQVFSARVGEFVGPLQVGKYVSIMQVIGRRPPRRKSFAEARAEIEQEHLWERQRQAVQEYLEAKKKQIGVSVDRKRLADLSIKASP